MIPYKNKAGNSGIVAFEIGKTFIKLRFKAEPYVYTYTYSKPGKAHVIMMKQLAEKGKGLSTYVSREVRDNYASKA